jgi:hypothetical protein
MKWFVIMDCQVVEISVENESTAMEKSSNSLHEESSSSFQDNESIEAIRDCSSPLRDTESNEAIRDFSSPLGDTEKIEALSAEIKILKVNLVYILTLLEYVIFFFFPLVLFFWFSNASMASKERETKNDKVISFLTDNQSGSTLTIIPAVTFLHVDNHSVFPRHLQSQTPWPRLCHRCCLASVSSCSRRLALSPSPNDLGI